MCILYIIHQRLRLDFDAFGPLSNVAVFGPDLRSSLWTTSRDTRNLSRCKRQGSSRCQSSLKVRTTFFRPIRTSLH